MDAINYSSDDEVSSDFFDGYVDLAACDADDVVESAVNDVGRLEIKADQNAERSNSGIQSGTQEPQYQSVSNEGYELLKKYNANGRDPTLLSSKEIIECDKETWEDIRLYEDEAPGRSESPDLGVELEFADPPYANRNVTEVIEKGQIKIYKYGDKYPFASHRVVVPPPFDE